MIIYTLIVSVCGKYFPMNVTGHVTEKLTLIFRHLGLYICRFSINIRIEVRFFALGNERIRVACKSLKALRAPHELHVTCVLSFPNTNKK